MTDPKTLTDEELEATLTGEETTEDSSSETDTTEDDNSSDPSVPMHRFREVNKKVKDLESELAEAKKEHIDASNQSNTKKTEESPDDALLTKVSNLERELKLGKALQRKPEALDFEDKIMEYSGEHPDLPYDDVIDLIIAREGTSSPSGPKSNPANRRAKANKDKTRDELRKELESQLKQDGGF